MALSWAGETNRLVTTVTGGGNDQTFSAPPPYQSGPLGDYYLPITTPLYHNGSRTAPDAGLYHYTTGVDQTKEGSGHMVSIGLHYIATAGAASIKPKDSDNDSMPDYVENWHGDGDYTLHTDTETDWQKFNNHHESRRRPKSPIRRSGPRRRRPYEACLAALQPGSSDSR